MKFAVKRKELLKALRLVSHAVDTKTPMPILQGVLFEVGDGLRVSGTDLTTVVTAKVSATTESPGRAAAGVKALLKVVSQAAAGDDLSIELEGNVLHLYSGRCQFDLVAYSADDFPKLPAPGALADVDGAAIEDVLVKAVYAASSDITQPNLCGVMLSIGGGNAEARAVDGHRLVIATRACGGDLAPFFLPVSGAKNLLRVVGEEAKIGVDKDRLFVEAGGAIVSVRRGEDRFPPLENAIPRDQAAHVTVSKKAFTDALAGAATAADSVLLESFTGKLRVTAWGGGYESMIDAEHEGEPVSVRLTIKYLLQALEHFGGDHVRIGTTGELDSITIREDGYLAVVAPCRKDLS